MFSSLSSFSSTILNLNRPDYRGLRFPFSLIFDRDGPPGVYGFPRGTLVKLKHQWLITATARAEGINDVEKIDEDVNKGTQISVEKNSDSEHQQKASQLQKRVIFGPGIGFSAGGVVLAGSWIFTMALAAVGAGNTLSGVVASWPVLLGGQTRWTVGLVATLISVSSIIASWPVLLGGQTRWTYAFIWGKAFGRTPLTSISPKKTWEGALAGLGGCISTSLILAKTLGWPISVLSAVAFGFLNYFGSLFGDLTESMIKRDAGVKDSGSFIPGHGGILDRVDSYIFTGAVAYSFIKIFLPLYGV